MKYIIVSLFFLQLSFGQNNLEISYIIKYNTEIYNERNGTLILDLKQNKAVFFISKINLKKDLRAVNNEINIIQKDDERYIATDLINDSLFSKEKIKNGNYIVSENVPKMSWELATATTKKIGDYICYKATTNFRGRNFTAWYSTDYPVQLGPWKFNGLPGLIMEVYDETNRYYWGVIEIKPTNKEVVFPNDISLHKKIDLKKYVELRYDTNMDNLDSRLPRGTQTQTIKVERNGLEIKFEWEK
ncbi:GLPGLI family protein [Flavobacterium sp. K5-23]|uniref:GLPGLI family protein n=1 Tax=Flavobacterium sp. K5-23 TaxID=2746225 RepID=UPI00200D38D5|nr:GLPGLI family protein [Flavobacterium sp. K5-23]UQD55770.1 GLPGLI family protein [Flavobacterium sp. K5-23]